MEQRILDKLLELSKNAGREIPVAALIYDENKKIISSSVNNCEKKDMPLYHAEIMAIEEALKVRRHSLKNCTLAVTLEPCLMCYGAALNADISTIIYLVKNSDSGAFSYFHADTQKNRVIIHFEENEELKRLLQNFFVDRRK